MGCLEKDLRGLTRPALVTWIILNVLEALDGKKGRGEGWSERRGTSHGRKNFKFNDMSIRIHQYV